MSDNKGKAREFKGDELRDAIRAIMGNKTPKNLTIEFQEEGHFSSVDAAGDDDGGWSGNVYKYSF